MFFLFRTQIITLFSWRILTHTTPRTRQVKKAAVTAGCLPQTPRNQRKSSTRWSFENIETLKSGIVFWHQNLTSKDVIFWRLKTVPALVLCPEQTVAVRWCVLRAEGRIRYDILLSRWLIRVFRSSPVLFSCWNLPDAAQLKLRRALEQVRFWAATSVLVDYWDMQPTVHGVSSKLKRAGNGDSYLWFISREKKIMMIHRLAGHSSNASCCTWYIGLGCTTLRRGR